MWSAIRELMEQLEEPIVVLGSDGEIAVINSAAQNLLGHSMAWQNAPGLRVLRVPTTAPHQSAHLDDVSSDLSVVLAIRTTERYLYISPNCKQFLGHEAEGLYESVGNFINLVHPEDRDYVTSIFAADAAGYPQEYECRLMNARREWRRIHVKVHPFLDNVTGQLLIASLIEDITEAQQPRERKEPLAGLKSMIEFRRSLEASVDAWASPVDSRFFALAFIDLVRFRAVNESFGYSQGDLLLEQVASRIIEVLPAKDRVAGFGSDQYGILLRSATDEASAEVLIRSVLQALSVPIDLDGKSIHVAARAGLAFPRGMDTTTDTMLRNADAALQSAKQRREPLIVSTISRAARSVEQSSLEFDLARALDNDEFFFEFQPVFNPANGTVRLLEALIRWRHPRLGVISPSSFISLAEDSGLVLRLDMQGLERLARQLDYWRTAHPQLLEIPFSINISGRHFPNFVMEEQFHRLLQSPALKLCNIIFEITESVFVESNAATASSLESLRKAGVEIWLDDFGDGYSSFRYLAHFPVDGIKIGESFVKNCAREEKSRVILSSIQTLARGLGVQIVVEGVETREQFDTLYTMGFDAVQGFYLSRPIAAKDLPELLESSYPRPRARGHRA